MKFILLLFLLFGIYCNCRGLTQIDTSNHKVVKFVPLYKEGIIVDSLIKAIKFKTINSKNPIVLTLINGKSTLFQCREIEKTSHGYNYDPSDKDFPIFGYFCYQHSVVFIK